MTVKHQALKNSKKVWAAILLSFAVFIISPKAYAYERPPYQQHIFEYQIYASGFRVLNANLAVEYGGEIDYSTTLTANTRGWLGKLVPWSGNYKTTGNIRKNGTKHPKEHLSSSIWKKSLAKKNFSYKEDGALEKLYLEEKGRDYTPENFDYEIAKDTIDLLTATLLMMEQLPETNSCESESLVFDGKRSFKLKFADIKTVELKSNRYNSYSGSANKCTIEVEPDKGHWREKPRGWLSIQEQGRNKGSLPTIWMGEIEGTNLYVPVKIMIKTDYGALVMHLKKHRTVKEKKIDQ